MDREALSCLAQEWASCSAVPHARPARPQRRGRRLFALSELVLARIGQQAREDFIAKEQAAIR